MLTEIMIKNKKPIGNILVVLVNPYMGYHTTETHFLNPKMIASEYARMVSLFIRLKKTNANTIRNVLIYILFFQFTWDKILPVLIIGALSQKQNKPFLKTTTITLINDSMKKFPRKITEWRNPRQKNSRKSILFIIDLYVKTGN